MPQDAFTLRYLTEELDAIFSGGTINRITVPDNDTVVFTVYVGKGTKKMMISANPSSPRISLYTGEETAPLTAPNFCMLLRKHLIGAKIVKIELVGFDRIVKMTCLYKGEFSDGVEKIVYAELMGRYSNVILTENGKVLGCNRGVNFFDNGVRPLISGKPYTLPPTKDKLVPTDVALIEELKNMSVPLAEFLFSKLTGLSAVTATEIAFSYAKEIGVSSDVVGENVKKDPISFFDFLQRFIYSEKRPCVSEKDGELLDVYAFIYLSASGELKFYDSLCVAENAFFNEKEKSKRFREKKEKLLRTVENSAKKVKKRLSTLYARKADAANLEENRLKGELIIANIYKLRYGDEELVAENYYDDDKKIVIPLDKTLSPSDNAKRYFKKYDKQKRVLENTEPFIISAESEYEYLQTLIDFINIAETEDDLNTLYFEAEENGIVKPQKIKKKKIELKHFRRYSYMGFDVLVGRSNIENDQLVYSATEKDLWLHSKNFHSSHVIVKGKNETFPEKVIIFAAELCAYYSKCKDGKSEIVYTKRANLRKPKGAKAGLWNYNDYNSLTVNPDPHEDKREKTDA